MLVAMVNIVVVVAMVLVARRIVMVMMVVRGEFPRRVVNGIVTFSECRFQEFRQVVQLVFHGVGIRSFWSERKNI